MNAWKARRRSGARLSRQRWLIGTARCRRRCPGGVTALVMRLTAKDPAYRPDDAAEVAVWAGLLRDGLGAGLAPLRIWPQATPSRPPRAAARPGHHTLLSYGCIAIMAVVIMVLASIFGFSSPKRQVSAASAAPAWGPGAPRGNNAPRLPDRDHRTSTGQAPQRTLKTPLWASPRRKERPTQTNLKPANRIFTSNRSQ
jgi:hypothetical protein